MFSKMKESRTGELHFRCDEKTGLQAIIAIHDTSRGPALGGCRFIPYQDSSTAIQDAIRLAQGMSYKAALAGVDQGGGKAVIMAPGDGCNRAEIFKAFGEFVESLGGRYITAMDAGTTTADMDVIASQTSHITCTSASGDPAPYTALGVFHGIQACLKSCADLPDDLKGVKVAVQGLGHVGEALCGLLHQAGAELIVCDIDHQKVSRCEQAFGAKAVEPSAILSTECDVFSPCGLGGVITADTPHSMKCRAVAGSANNQLASPEAGLSLHRQGILYAPDYLINAGGLVHASLAYNQQPAADIRQRIQGIESTLMQLFRRHLSSGEPTSLIADRMAADALYGPEHLERLSA